MPAVSADLNLLFGLLALQTGIIDQAQLVAAFQAWTLDKARSLADHLEARGDVTGPRRAALEALAAVHVESHGGDVAKSLAAVPANGDVIDPGRMPFSVATRRHVCKRTVDSR
jgi:hypothetical protein